VVPTQPSNIQNAARYSQAMAAGQSRFLGNDAIPGSLQHTAVDHQIQYTNPGSSFPVHPPAPTQPSDIHKATESSEAMPAGQNYYSRNASASERFRYI